MPSQQRITRSRALLPTKSFVAIIGALLAMLAMATMTWSSNDTRARASRAMRRSTETQLHLSRLLRLIVDAETGQRGFLLTGKTSYLEPFERARISLPAELGQLETLFDGEYNPLLTELTQVSRDKLAELDSTIAMKRSGQDAKAVQMVETDRGKALMDRIRGIVDEIATSERGLAEERSAEWESSVMWSTYVTYGGTALLLTMLGLVGFFASRDFRSVENESWARRVQVDLGGRLQGDLKLTSLGDTILSRIVPNLGAQVGAVYVTEPGWLHRIGGHALDPKTDAATQKIELGDGLAGQAALDNRVVHMTKLPADYLPVSSALGQTKPRELLIVPASVDDKVQAVIELAFLHEVDAIEIDALARMSETIALAVRSARDRSRLEELLEETQRQAEELQAQQEELRVTNEELEQQSKTLQLSQTQLENQQSELEQINSQLEEQSQSLERQRDELARAGSDLQRSNEYKSQFLANMSHELRTPLNSSLILAKLLADNREGNLNEEQVKFASTIYSAGNDLLTLINDILDLSKIEAGMLEVRPEPIVLGRLLDDLTATFQQMAQQKHLELAMSLAPGTPESFESDSTRLQQILKNLVSNALKFTEHGGVTLEVSTRGDAVAFSVRDTGIGIAPDQHDLIFEAFRQADGASTRKFGGTGLGLSISRDLARLLGGDLKLDSAPGRGSTFTLTLPLRIAARTAPGPSVRPAKPPAPSARPAPPPVQLARPAPFPDDRDKITADSRALLLVEDDVAFARVLYDLAHELEFQAVVATTAEDALALARQVSPSAIVLDVSLPDRSGLAVLDVLKRDARTRHVPVHMVSAHDYARTALEMGAAGYALKPIERDQLVEAIKKLEQKFTHKLRRVLVVEDDPLLRESTARLLSTDDVQTVPVGTSAEALQLLETQTFDCMVLDLALPDRSGVELLEEISRGEQYSFPPVIVYTGRSLNFDQVHELEKFSRSIIIKGARSPERLLDEVTLFLHQVEADLPPERQRMLRDARDREALFEGKRIMIVEDDVRNVFALSAVLEPKGAKVVIARNGREAIDQLRADPNVDLVLMDIMMPEMDGIEATKALRAQAQFAKLPIIALTAKAMIDDREKCLAAGANDYIAKPLDVDKLLSLARVWIRK